MAVGDIAKSICENGDKILKSIYQEAGKGTIYAGTSFVNAIHTAGDVASRTLGRASNAANAHNFGMVGNSFTSASHGLYKLNQKVTNASQNMLENVVSSGYGVAQKYGTTKNIAIAGGVGAVGIGGYAAYNAYKD